MSHYFSPDDHKSGEDLRRVNVRIHQQSFSFFTDSGVFSKKQVDFGSRLLLDTVQVKNAKTVLDLGCGYGPIGLVVALRNPDVHVTMVDINPKAIRLARRNATHYVLNDRTSIHLSDGFTAIPESRFDLILCNPPIRAGKSVIYSLFQEAKEHLNQGGSLSVVIRKQQGAESAKKELEKLYPKVEILQKKKGYWIIQSTMI